MAITPTVVVSTYDGADGSLYVTGSLSPTDGYHKIKVCSTRATSDPSIPTIEGWGLTWTQVETVLYRTGGAQNHRLTEFEAIGTPTPGVLSIIFGTPPLGNETQTSCVYQTIGYTEIDTADPIVQVVTANGNGPTLAATLAAFADATNNACDASGSMRSNTAYTPGTGLTDLADVTGAAPANSLMSEFRVGQDTSPDMSADSGSTNEFGMIASELRFDAGADTPPVLSVALQGGSNQSSALRAVPQPAPQEQRNPQPGVFVFVFSAPPVYHAAIPGFGNYGYTFRPYEPLGWPERPVRSRVVELPVAAAPAPPGPSPNTMLVAGGAYQSATRSAPLGRFGPQVDLGPRHPVPPPAVPIPPVTGYGILRPWNRVLHRPART